MNKHNFDEVGFCLVCGFDGNEWLWWKHTTDEGKASEEPMPPCEGLQVG